MFGIGMPELLLILAVALVVLGPKRLPELARSLGKGLAELKKSTNDLKQNIDLGDEFKQVQQDFQDVKSGLQDIADTAYLDAPPPDYLKETGAQTAVSEATVPAAAVTPEEPLDGAATVVMSTPAFPPPKSPDLHGDAEDVREALAEAADQIYQEHHPYPPPR